MSPFVGEAVAREPGDERDEDEQESHVAKLGGDCEEREEALSRSREKLGDTETTHYE